MSNDTIATDAPPCALCGLYTTVAHDEHADWREIATSEELAALDALMEERAELDRAFHQVHSRSRELVAPINQRAVEITRDNSSPSTVLDLPN